MRESKVELERMRAIIQYLPDNVLFFNEEGYCLDYFEGDENVLPIDRASIIGKHLSDIAPRGLVQKFLKCLNDSLTDKSTQYITYSVDLSDVPIESVASMTADTKSFEGRVVALPLRDDGKRVIMWVSRDVTMSRIQENEVKFLADHDELTGVYSRRKFMNKLTKAHSLFRQSKCDMAVIIFDIDDFKIWNDSLGHLGGDKVIKHVTDTCSKAFRKTDCFGRLGGDEFAALLMNTGFNEAERLCERLRLAIHTSPCCVYGKEVNVSVSLGVASFNALDTSHKDILRRADNALYESKENGKNRMTVNF